jgi:hypothetical protein
LIPEERRIAASLTSVSLLPRDFTAAIISERFRLENVSGTAQIVPSGGLGGKRVNKFFPEKLQLGAVRRGLRAAPCSDEAAERLGVGKDKV